MSSQIMLHQKHYAFMCLHWMGMGARTLFKWKAYKKFIYKKYIKFAVQGLLPALVRHSLPTELMHMFQTLVTHACNLN